MSKQEVAKKLIKLRGTISREEVASAVNISLSALQMYETGQRMPKDEIKIRLANYYGVTVQDLFFANQLHKTCSR